MAFDLPTQMGYDSDHPMAQGEVGRVGVAISSLEDITTEERTISQESFILFMERIFMTLSVIIHNPNS